MTGAPSTTAPGPAVTARTMLFVPGSRPDRFAKAAATAADLVLIDLEDAVAEHDKDAAREAVTAWLADDGRAAVRVNSTASPQHDEDIAALAGLPGLQAIVVPMADNTDAVTAVHQHLGPGVDIVAFIETAVGLVRAVELASTPGVARLAFGHLDFAADIGAETDDDAMLMARSTMVVASRAAGLPGPVDGVTTALDEPALAGADASRARRLGFAGKLCIHPGQVDAVNSAFSPSDQDIAWAHRILAAVGGGGAVRVDGHMVDAPVILKAEAILARASLSRAQERT
jgi:citrate lyase subunit beta / citryl-CoA lyase